MWLPLLCALPRGRRCVSKCQNMSDFLPASRQAGWCRWPSSDGSRRNPQDPRISAPALPRGGQVVRRVNTLHDAGQRLGVLLRFANHDGGITVQRENNFVTRFEAELLPYFAWNDDL